MSDEEQDEIEIIDDTPDGDRGGDAVDEESLDRELAKSEARAEGRVINPDTMKVEVTKPVPEEYSQRFKVLKFKAEHERREKEKVARQLDASSEYAKNTKATADALAARLQQLEGSWKQEAVGRRASEIGRTQQELSSAIEAADAGKQAELQARMAQLAQERQSAEMFQPTNYGQIVPQAPDLGQPMLAQRTVDWISDEKQAWFRENQTMQRDAIAIADRLERSGMSVQSDQYYDTIETEIQQKYPEAFSKAASQQRRSTAPVAAVPRVNANGAAPRKVQVTKSEAEFAERIGVPLKEFIKSKQILADQRK